MRVATVQNPAATMPRKSQLPVKSTNNPQVERTRTALRVGLLSLLERKPLVEVKLQELASEAKVGYASFFRHYSTKEEILGEIVREQISGALDAAATVVDREDTYAGCLSLCRHIDQNRRTWSTLLRAAPELLREELVRLTIQKRPRKNRDQKWVSVELGTRVGVASMIEIIRWWMDDPASLTPQQAAKILNRMVVAPALAAR